MRRIASRPTKMDRALLGLGLIAVGCVQDFDVEDEVLPPRGASQPAPEGSRTIGRAAACDEVTGAEMQARERLDCSSPDRAPCPEYLNVAGALPCETLNRASVTACVEQIEQYSSCEDFDQHPCIVTVAIDSCVAPRALEGGADAVVGAVDGAADASGPDPDVDGGALDGASVPGDNDASVPNDASAPGDASVPGDARPAEAGLDAMGDATPVPTDAATDASTD